MFLPAVDVGQQMPLITTGALPAAAAASLYGNLQDGEPLQVTAIEIRALCQAAACSYR